MASTQKFHLAAVVIWALLIAAGMSVTGRYDNTPGPARPVASSWPPGTSLTLSPGHLTLLVFVHPECSCTAATLTEIEGLLARHRRTLDVTLIAIIPPARIEQWEHSRLLQRAAAIPGLRVFYDYGSVEAERFGALTSGYSLAYSSSGKLRFAGGLTQARGQTGNNLGIETLDQLAENLLPSRNRNPVFGCELRNPVPSGGSK